MERSHRVSIEKLVERQIQMWQAKRRAEDEGRAGRDPALPEAIHPWVAVSRQVAGGGNEFAQALADRLGFHLFDREVVDYIAERAHVRTAAVKSLGETWFDTVHDWISGIIDERFLAVDDYARHLVEVVGTIAAQGPAVFVGRGVGFFLPRERGLRVRVVAPMETRIAYAIREYQMTEAAARELLIRSDASRVGFAKAYFNVDIQDPLNHDLTVNLDRCPIAVGVEACVGMLEAITGYRPPRAGG